MNNDADKITMSAVEQFRRARLQAKVEQIKAALTGKSADLLSYEEVREKVRARESNRRQLKEIPLDAIVGSVGRYRDFTRRFLPLLDDDAQRWIRVLSLSGSMEGLPPIEVYQLGEVYFVRDGNHRVSIAHEIEATHIEAYVTQVEAAVPLTPDIQPDDLITKERYAHFLNRTQLKDTYPDLDLSMSAAGNYRVLERQIGVHQLWVKEHKGEEISYIAAAARWYKYIYWPVIQIIRQRGIMRDFPGRTETDLYVWIDKHRAELAAELGWSVDAQQAVRDLAQKQAADANVLQRLGKKLINTVTPTVLETGPAVGEWRDSWLDTYREEKLFNHILVAVDGHEAGWHALQQALRLAHHEGGKIFGLHVTNESDTDNEQRKQTIAVEFNDRCRQMGIEGEISFASGPVTGTICYRARWADLVIVSLSHPPGPNPADRLGSQFAQMLRRCPRPILAVPRLTAGYKRLLLAYDGSPKANEALVIARYMVEQWDASLQVVAVADTRGTGRNTAVRAHKYLQEHNIPADYLAKNGEPAPIILQAARDIDCDLIIMGGYGSNPLSSIVSGSVVDEVLRTRNRPVLICR